jgi:hypothetical protein
MILACQTRKRNLLESMGFIRYTGIKITLLFFSDLLLPYWLKNG